MSILDKSNGFPRARRLSVCLALSLGLACGAASATPMPRSVTTCDDDAGNPDSLRAQVAAAASGDTIDLSPLLMVCSTITLGSEIDVQQDTLYFQGPGAAYLAIDGNHQSRIFKHSGMGTVGVSGLALKNGHYASTGMVSTDTSDGGCIYSSSNVTLVHSTVSDCTVEHTGPGSARGGAVFSGGDLSLFATEITRDTAYASIGNASGGAAYAYKAFSAKYSTIADSVANTPDVQHDSAAGGVFVLLGPAAIHGSTISGNRSDRMAALAILSNRTQPSDTIVNSTISGNAASFETAGVWTNSSLSIYNSTIAFNHTSTVDGNFGAGLYIEKGLVMQSSIVADNFTLSVPADIDGVGQVITGAHNLVYESHVVLPLDTTWGVCPALQPLAYNGGPTRTHAPRHLNPSPTIDLGGNPLNLATDQRLLPRLAGALPDIGSVESQPGETDEDIFIAGFDGLCDQ